jgi:hypothetical protein
MIHHRHRSVSQSVTVGGYSRLEEFQSQMGNAITDVIISRSGLPLPRLPTQ